ncbi:2-succinyl-5-enolpyruvyl-6-hydroxy-3-cyclohexene-1-carboxylic-acid synthase [Kistimonas asteriae]|uniref:2-succinyl-5-enolpyruvyl-6-hydroxy-3- cyclohexene-1-carboxylic-acid synthase n=1 Tax=Kistimonas asteriae TaxID=517724 RepID=UPI001BA5723C|nr:2-succinyl-5-enolpyruvyl-6-hydroxy-3-cyclohexene-1-carboxylic-acid synthase [Kistimonas asteriae]
MAFNCKLSDINSLWCALIMEELVRNGVEHCCIAPGSRNSPLTHAAAAHTRLNKHVHFDERGLGFFALGIAKSTRKPVAIITTSGTAVANLYPAVIEAAMMGIPLLILSADRPAELLDTGANQTINQTAIFSHYPVQEVQLPCPDMAIAPQWLLSTLDQGITRARTSGVVHLNLHLRDPLYPGPQYPDWSAYMAPVTDWMKTQRSWTHYCLSGQQLPDEAQVLVDRLFAPKGVLVAGQLAPDDAQAVARLAEKLGWPLLVDVQSHLHGHSLSLPHVDLLLNNDSVCELLDQADTVLQFGGRLVGKRLSQWLANGRRKHYCFVDSGISRLDPACNQSLRIQANITKLCRFLEASLPGRREPGGWYAQLMDYGIRCREALARLFQVELNEMWVSRHVVEQQRKQGCLFIGNSMPIRLIDSLSDARLYGDIMTNRGASGIDGLIATAAGVAATGRHVTLLLGDLSFLHDLNSLALLRDRSVTLVLLNNDGGSIFNMLPVARDGDLFKRYFQVSHGLNAEQAAAMFDIHYETPVECQAFAECYEQAATSEKPAIIEVKTPATEATDMLRRALAMASEL